MSVGLTSVHHNSSSLVIELLNVLTNPLKLFTIYIPFRKNDRVDPKKKTKLRIAVLIRTDISIFDF